MVLNATDITILIPAEGGGYARIAHTTSAEVSLAGEERLTTNFDDQGWETSVITNRRWSMTGSSLMTFEAGYSFDHLFDLWQAGNNILVRWATQSEQGYYGYAKIIDLSAGGGTEQNVQVNFSFKGQGAFSRLSPTTTTLAGTIVKP